MIRRMVTIEEHVDAARREASPYALTPSGAPVVRLDAVKTARDLGHLEPETVDRLHRLRMPAPMALRGRPLA